MSNPSDTLPPPPATVAPAAPVRTDDSNPETGQTGKQDAAAGTYHADAEPTLAAEPPKEDPQVDYVDPETVARQHKAVMQRYLKRGMPVLFDTGKDKLAAIICDVHDEDAGVVTLHVFDTSGFSRPEASVPFGEGHRTWSLQSWV